MFTGTRSFLRGVWAITAPYWRSEERWRSGALLLVIIILNLASVYISVQFNYWYKMFYDALQHKDFQEFIHQIIRFSILAFLAIVIAVYSRYFLQMLQIRWRRWLTGRYTTSWLADHTYHRLQLSSQRVDNPDQRISEDINTFVANMLSLGFGLMASVVSLLSFAAILWSISGPLNILGVNIPGYLLWAAVIYAVLGTWLTHVIGRQLIWLNFQQQRYEADFRFALARLRENAESVALYRGEEPESKNFSRRFTNVLDNFWGIMRRTKLLNWFSNSYAQAAIIFPYVVAAPAYFFGKSQLGDLMQIGSAFSEVQTALSWFVTSYPLIANWKATADRLILFERAMSEVETLRPTELRRGVAAPRSGIAVQDLDIWLPDGTPLLNGVDFRLPPGSRTLVTGPSGAGKSTLFRVIAGLWPWCRGLVCLPEGERVLFLPQKAYLPIGQLRVAAAYPGETEAHDDAAIAHALRECGLGHLVASLGESRHWAQELSPGEQQRLAFARALLLKPRWLFLDEATSALDEAAAFQLHALLSERLPGVAIVSISHHAGLTAFHDRRIMFVKPDSGARYVLHYSDMKAAVA